MSSRLSSSPVVAESLAAQRPLWWSGFTVECSGRRSQGVLCRPSSSRRRRSLGGAPQPASLHTRARARRYQSRRGRPGAWEGRRFRRIKAYGRPHSSVYSIEYAMVTRRPAVAADDDADGGTRGLLLAAGNRDS